MAEATTGHASLIPIRIDSRLLSRQYTRIQPQFIYFSISTMPLHTYRSWLDPHHKLMQVIILDDISNYHHILTAHL